MTRAHAPAQPSAVAERLKPAAGFTKRDFLCLHELDVAEMAALLDLAARVKARPRDYASALAGPPRRAAALIFEKQSLRTRVTFEVGMAQLGGSATYLAPGDISLGRREAVKDVARNLARWVQVLIIRTFGHEILEEMAREASIPIINALSDLHHPCQSVADVLTIREYKGNLKGLKLAFVGDGNNVAHSLLQAGAKLGMDVTVACPRGFEPDAVVFRQARQDAEATGARLLVVNDPADGVFEADAVYTDVWTSMGQEAEANERRNIFSHYQVNSYLMSLAKPDAIFLHCLPAHRGEEVTDQVLDGPQSVVLDQAENRLHVAKAVLLALLSGESR